MAADTKATLQIITQAVDKFTAPMSAMSKALDKFGGSLRRIGENVASFAIFDLGRKMVSWTRDIATTVTALDVHARRLGVSVEALSRWRFASEAAGISAEGFERGLLKIQSAIEKARDGTFDFVELFDVLGVKVDEFTRPLDILPQIADGFSKLQNPADKATASMRLLGNESNELIGLLGLGKDRIAELMEESDRFGATIDSKTVKSLKDFELALHKVETTTKFFARTVLTAFAEDITPSIENFANFLANNKEVVGAFFVALERRVLEWGKGTVGTFGEVAKAIAAFFATTEAQIDAKLVEQTANVAALQRMVARGDRDAFTMSELKRHQALLDALGAQKRAFLESGESIDELDKALQRLTEAWEKSGPAAVKTGDDTKASTDKMAAGLAGVAKAYDQAEKAASKFNGTTFGAGAADAMLALQKRYRDHAAVGKQAVLDLADAFESRLGEAIVAAMNNWKDFGDAFRKVAASFLLDLQRLIAKVIAFRIVSALFGSGAAPGGEPGSSYNLDIELNRGGGLAGRNRVFQFARGGMVPGTRTSWDTVPAMLSPREFVMRTSAVDHYGVSMMNALNRQQLPREAFVGNPAAVLPVAGGGSVTENHYHYNITAMDAQDVTRALMKAREGFSGMVRKSLTEDRATIQAVRGVMR